MIAFWVCISLSLAASFSLSGFTLQSSLIICCYKSALLLLFNQIINYLDTLSSASHLSHEEENDSIQRKNKTQKAKNNTQSPQPTMPTLTTTLLPLLFALTHHTTAFSTIDPSLPQTFLFANFPDTGIYTGSLVAAHTNGATISLQCQRPTATDDYRDCGLFPTHHLVVGESLYSMDMAIHESGIPDFTATMSCPRARDTGSVRAVTCYESASGEEANFPGSSSEVYEGRDVGTLTVVVTAGLEEVDSVYGPGGMRMEETGRPGVEVTATVTGTGTEVVPSASSGVKGNGSAEVVQEEEGAASKDGVLLGGSLVGAFVVLMGAVLL